MANFVPFKENYGNNNSSAPTRTRRATEGVFANLLSRSGSYKRFGCSLARSSSAPQVSRVPFLRLNSYGAEEMDCSAYSFAQKQQQTGTFTKSKFKDTSRGLNRMDRCEASKICQVVDCIRECCSHLMKRGMYKPHQSSSFCAMECTDRRIKCDNCGCSHESLQRRETDMPAHVPLDSLSGYQAAPSRQTNGYLNDCGTDMDVNNQLIIDLIGDCLNPLLLPDVTQPAKKSKDDNHSPTVLNVSSPSTCDMDSRCGVVKPATSLPTSLNCAETDSGDFFLVHTMQQRLNKETRKAARKRKRNRHQARSSLSFVEVDDTVKQLFDNCASSFLSTSPLFSMSPGGVYSTRVVSFSNDEDEEEEEEEEEEGGGEEDSDSDDSDWQVTFSDSFGVINLDSCSGITRLRPTTLHPHHGSPDSSCSDNSDRLTGDHDDDVKAVREEVQRANSRWKECYGSCGSYSLEDWLSVDESDERYPVCRVSFANGTSLVTEHELDDADEVRKGPWEEIGIDRQRFQKRIADVATVLQPVLDCEHRAKVLSSWNLSAESVAA